MIYISETWLGIFEREGLKLPRRGRAACPFCESRTGFSCHEEKGFHCFACDVHGDKISFIQQLHKCTFKDALRFFGLEPGRPLEPDHGVLRKKKARAGLLAWSKRIGKELRFELYVRNLITVRALRRLRKDSEDSHAWSWLSWTLKDYAALEYELDRIEGSESEKLEAYREWRAAA